MPVRRILALHTSTHAPEDSSSAALTRTALEKFQDLNPKVEIRWIDAADLHIAKNLSCYANGKSNCGDPQAGPYRCWAHVMSQKDPDKYGVDQMPVIYDALHWCDTLLFSTSTRWGSHTAAAQTVIERMNTLENRGSSLGEPYPMLGKRLGVIATGLHWRTAAVAAHLVDTLRWWGFATAGEASALAWQRSGDPFFEHPDSDTPYAERWLLTTTGRAAVDRFVRAVSGASRIDI